MNATSTGLALRLDRISAGCGNRVVLEDVTIHVGLREVVAVMGPSGCGKSTLVRLAAGLQAPRAGAVTAGFSETARTAVMFQNPLLQPWLTVSANVALPARLRGENVDGEALLDAVCLRGLGGRYPYQLSGGEQRRVALARALAQSPRLLCLDEPFSGVDELTRESLLALISAVVSERDLSCLLVTHSPLESVFLADRVIVLGGKPSRIVGEIVVHLPRPRPQCVVDTGAFDALVRQVRRLLRESGSR